MQEDETPITRIQPETEHFIIFKFGDAKRSYVIQAPPANPSVPKPPIVIAFHGYPSSGHLFRDYCGMHIPASKAGYISVFPSGTGTLSDFSMLSWQKDDHTFFGALMADISKRIEFDSTRVNLLGFSHGAHMVFKILSVFSASIAAMALVEGMDAPQKEEIPWTPLPWLFITVKLDRSESHHLTTNLTDRLLNYEEALQLWLFKNNLSEKDLSLEATLEWKPPPRDDGISSPPDHVHRAWKERFKSADGKADVVRWRLEGMGHVWPGATGDAIWTRALGEKTKIIDASEESLKFFTEANSLCPRQEKNWEVLTSPSLPSVPVSKPAPPATKKVIFGGGFRAM